MHPDDYYYTKDHEWVKIEGDVGTIGITDFAQKQFCLLYTSPSPRD